jgi:uncharacterized BrkB/YihY/UPF0761 family membrane protein
MEFDKQREKNLSDQFESIYRRINRWTFGILDILRTSIARFSEKQGIEGAASIDFFKIFTLSTLLTVTVTIGSLFLKNLDIQALILHIAERSLPIPSDVMINLINEIQIQRTSLVFISLTSLVWPASGML